MTQNGPIRLTFRNGYRGRLWSRSAKVALGILLMASPKMLIPILLLLSSILSELIIICCVQFLFSDLSALLRRTIFPRQYLLPILSRIGTPKLQSFIVRLLPWNVTREFVELVDILHNTSLDIIKSRKMALEEGKASMDRQVGGGKDMITMLCKPSLSFTFFIH
jgi:hypothetical protein